MSAVPVEVLGAAIAARLGPSDLEAASAGLRERDPVRATIAEVSCPSRVCTTVSTWFCPPRRRPGAVVIQLRDITTGVEEDGSIETRLATLRRQASFLWKKYRVAVVLILGTNISLVIGLGFLTDKLAQEMFRHKVAMTCTDTLAAVLAGPPVPDPSVCRMAKSPLSGRPSSIQFEMGVSTTNSAIFGIMNAVFLFALDALVATMGMDRAAGFSVSKTHGCLAALVVCMLIGFQAAAGGEALKHGETVGTIMVCNHDLTNKSVTLDTDCEQFGNPSLDPSSAWGWLMGGTAAMVLVSSALVMGLSCWRGRSAHAARAYDEEARLLDDGGAAAASRGRSGVGYGAAT